MSSHSIVSGKDIREFLPPIPDQNTYPEEYALLVAATDPVVRLAYRDQCYESIQLTLRSAIDRYADTIFDPMINRHFHRQSGKIKMVSLRAAQLIATLDEIDLANDVQYRWLRFFGDEFHQPRLDLLPDDAHAWNLSEVWSTPTGITLGTITDTEQMTLSPLRSDIEMAAMFELDEVYGGEATRFFRSGYVQRQQDIWRTGGTRVKKYFDYNKGQFSNRTPDFDIFDPIYWGHDARLKTLLLTESGIPPNRVLELTPEFDPDIFEYTVNESIAPPKQLTYESLDPLHDAVSSTSSAYSQSNTVLTIRVTAADGTTTQDYVIRAIL